MWEMLKSVLDSLSKLGAEEYSSSLYLTQHATYSHYQFSLLTQLQYLSSNSLSSMHCGTPTDALDCFQSVWWLISLEGRNLFHH